MICYELRTNFNKVFTGIHLPELRFTASSRRATTALQIQRAMGLNIEMKGSLLCTHGSINSILLVVACKTK